MKCIFEKDYAMPLCVKEDNIFYDLFSGEVIENESKLNFINKGIKEKRLLVKECKISIYIVYSYIMPTYDRSFEYYCISINGVSCFLDMKKQPVTEQQRQFIIQNFAKGKLFREKIWGDDN